MTEFETWRVVFDVAQAVIIVVLFIYTWISNRSKANRSAIDRVDGRVSDLATRTQSLETRMDHMPGDRHIQDIHEKINELAKNQAKSLGTQQAISRQLAMLNEQMLKGN